MLRLNRTQIMSLLTRIRQGGASGTVVLLLAVSNPAEAHVKYVTEREGRYIAAIRFLFQTVTDFQNAVLLLGGGLVAVTVTAGYLRFRPFARDVTALCNALEGYSTFVPWILRLSLGLPLVGPDLPDIC